MPGPAPVRDTGHSQDHIALAARVIGTSGPRREIFEAVYRGKRRIKSFSAIADGSRRPRKSLYNAAKHLEENQIIHQVRVSGEIGYQKDAFLDAHKAKVLSLAGNTKKLARFPTSTNPQQQAASGPVLKIHIPRRLVTAVQITIDDIDSFRRVRTVTSPPGHFVDILESRLKRGFQRILRQPGKFQGWGGEGNDLYTTLLRLNGKRTATAFGFKGRGTRKKLTPRDMGKNGDQIQRLFRSPAQVFLIQHVGQIDESIVEQMHTAAVAKSYSSGQGIYYGIIDGADTQRLMTAYRRAFA